MKYRGLSKRGIAVFALLLILGVFISTFSSGLVHATTQATPNPPSTTGKLPRVVQNPVPMLHVLSTLKPTAGASCGLVVPANPFSSVGLATPWQLVSGAANCHESDRNTAAFLQATIFDTATKQFFVYPPVVVDNGTVPAIAPMLPELPATAVVGIWGGSNGGALQLLGDGAGQCVNGAPGPFGQVFFCNASAFYTAVQASGVVLPALGTGTDGQACPSVRDFSIVDQDQSDNVQTQYLITASGQVAQDTAANEVALDQTGTFVTINPSDNKVLTAFVDKALGCTPAEAPDLANAGTMVPSQALDEIQAAMYQAQPQALIPAGDPMVLDHAGRPNLSKVNEYRSGADQPLATTLADANTSVYCVDILNAAPAKLLLDKSLFSGLPSPVPDQGSNLFTFMASRLSFTLSAQGLNCTGLLGVQNPVVLILDGQGIAISATIYGK